MKVSTERKDLVVDDHEHLLGSVTVGNLVIEVDEPVIWGVGAFMQVVFATSSVI